MSSFIPLDCLVVRTRFSQNAENNLIHREITLRLQAIYQKLGKRPSVTQGIGRFILCCNQGKKILVIEIVTGKNNGFPFLDILRYLKNTHKNPKFGKVRQVPTREFPTKFPDWDLSHSSKFGIFVGIL